MDRQFSSFRAKIDTDVLNDLNKIDSKVKNEVLTGSFQPEIKPETQSQTLHTAPAWSPEPVFTFGKPKSPMFNIRASPIPSPQPDQRKIIKPER